ncbi:unnamed protein product [Linum tenue]|jgi:hypothetical protein
MLSE